MSARLPIRDLDRRRARWLVGVLGGLLMASAPAPARAGDDARADSLEVLLPGRDNRQFLVYWVAEASGAFTAAGVDILASVAPSRGAMPDMLTARPDLCAVLPVPLLSRALVQGAPVKIVATLLAGDPANLVITTRPGLELPPGVTPSSPVAERITALRGKRIGLAHGPVPRLHALLAAGGLGEHDVEIRVLRGHEQLDALEKGEIDAVLAHTPYLEQMLTGDQARLWIHAAADEIPALAEILVHAFACGDEALTERREQVRAAMRALQHSARLIHAEPDRAAEHIGAALEQPVTEDLSLLVELYRPAIPEDLTPSPAALARSAALFPAFGERLSDDPAVLARYIADLDREPESPAPIPGESRGAPGSALPIVAAIVAMLALGFWLLLRRRPRGAPGRS